MVKALFLHGRITTTLARGKEFRPWAERLITIARKGAAMKGVEGDATWLNAYRRLLSVMHDETVTVKLLDEIGPSMADRPGGYTRLLRMPRGRLGDNAPTVVFELVTYDPAGADAQTV